MVVGGGGGHGLCISCSLDRQCSTLGHWSRAWALNTPLKRASHTFPLQIVMFSSFMGTLGYLSMLANYNSPVNE